MAPRYRAPENSDLLQYPGLGRYQDGRYFFKNPHTGRQASLKTKDLKQAVGRWALAKALCDSAYGDQAGAQLAEKLRQSNIPISKGANVHLCDFMKTFRKDVLEKGILRIKITRNKGEYASARTHEDYIKYSKQLEAHPDAAFPISSPTIITKTRVLLAHWLETPTHYNHLKAYLGRVYDHAVKSGLIESNPMMHVEKEAVPERKVLVPDDAYIRITEKLLIHRHNKREFPGEFRVKIADLLYMLSQQPIDLFDFRISWLKLKAGAYGEIHLARHKTSVEGIIEMNEAMRDTIDWLIAWRNEQLRVGNVHHVPETDHLMVFPAYMDKRHRRQPVTHRTFSKWWLEARREAGIEEDYWLMDMRKKGLTDEFVGQGENDKGLHETDRMKWHYRLVVPPKRSRNSLTPIGGRQ